MDFLHFRPRVHWELVRLDRLSVSGPKEAQLTVLVLHTNSNVFHLYDDIEHVLLDEIPTVLNHFNLTK